MLYVKNGGVIAAIRALIAQGAADALAEQEIRWNSHLKTVGHDAAYGMPWKTLMKMMTVKYCPRSEIKKTFYEESDEVEKYFGGLPDMIQGNVMSAMPKTMQEAIELANDLIDQK
ncbi:hypothetical protein Tco_0372638, partial [Tanacetum coccineum]